MKFISLIQIFAKMQLETSQLAKQALFLQGIPNEYMEYCLFLIDDSSKSRKDILVADQICKRIVSNEIAWHCYKASFQYYCKNLPLAKAQVMPTQTVIGIVGVLKHLGTVSSILDKLKVIRQVLLRLSREQKYWFFSILRAKLRIGFSNNAAIIALCNRMGKDLGACKKAYGLSQGLVDFWKRMHSENPFKVNYFTPLRPMLLKTVSNPRIARLLQLHGYLLQPKLDGFRIQIHHMHGQFKYYTRGMCDISQGLRPLSQTLFMVSSEMPNFILDGQLVSTNASFQQTSRAIMRKRPNHTLLTRLDLKFYAFDVIKKDDQVYINSPLDLRLAKLRTLMPHLKTPPLESKPVANLKNVIELANGQGPHAFEGVVIKRSDSPYRLGCRHTDWLKYKRKNYTGDLLVIAGKRGEGRRAAVYGSYLVACRKNGVLETIGFVGTGFSDATLVQYTRLFMGLRIANAMNPRWGSKHANENLHWFKPCKIFEVSFQELQVSKRYTSGHALRFPTHRGLRLDKTLDSITDLNEIKAIHSLMSNGL